MKTLLQAARRAAALALLLAGLRGGAARAQDEARTAAPDTVAVLSGAELSARADTIRAMYDRDPASLPRRDGPDGGAVFARLTAPVHVDRWTLPDLPLQVRMRELGALSTAYGRVFNTYGYAAARTGGYTEEVADLLGVGLHVQVRCLRTLQEAQRVPEVDTARVGGLLRTGLGGALEIVRAALAMVEAPDGLSAADRLRLVDRLIEEAPPLAAVLRAARALHVADAVGVTWGRVTDAELRARLGRLEAVMRTGAASTR